MTSVQLSPLETPLPPTQAELPYEDNQPMESQRHKVQMELLIDALLPWLEARDNGYIGGDMFIYFSLAQVRNQDFRGPDFFAVLGVPKGERLSWVCWEEGRSPDVVIELLSDSTVAADKGIKKQIYQDQLRVPEYFWYDPFNPDDWAGFYLRRGQYQPIDPAIEGHFVSQRLGLRLVKWSGRYKDINTTWLRWASLEGVVLPTEAELERQRADQEQQRADQEQQRADRLAEKLRELGLDPSKL